MRSFQKYGWCMFAKSFSSSMYDIDPVDGHVRICDDGIRVLPRLTSLDVGKLSHLDGAVFKKEMQDIPVHCRAGAVAAAFVPPDARPKRGIIPRTMV